jgi:hypothetical protein
MSEPENNPPPKENNERESIFRVLDELVSHMNTSRNVSMLLIVSAFILTPVSLVIAVTLLSAPAFVPGTEVHFIKMGLINGTGETVTISKFNGSIMEHKLMGVPPGVNISTGEVGGIVKGGANDFVYMPANHAQFLISGGPYMHQVLDISTIIIIFAVVSIVLSSIWLFIGIKEYSFFSKWNKKFARFMSLKDKVDKDLGER